MSFSTDWRPGAAMTIEHAAALWAEAQSHFAHAGNGTAMHIDLSAVERLDTAGCQMLLACREDARRRGAAWRLSGCGPEAIEVMRLLGCAEPLEAGAADSGTADSSSGSADATHEGLMEENAR
jgi:anti-anti-sigma regulatory factor